ncbi:uncharacterized protein LOC124284273 [Haliotis rubra]|uniref:uncharacterized protein LOC124284273 n=1 Tax=Haliotis rubra TaxID=36100 RepID=UPI001EE5E1B5|nr:uncharacterized protein LOC124284273 [Haliotis rubra]
MAGLGEVCSHVAALLFKVDAAVRAGLTSKACTSEACKWNAAYRKELQPTPLCEVQHLFGRRRKANTPSVSGTGKAPLPDIETLKSLKSVCPNAVFFKCIPPLDEEETDSAEEDGETHLFPPQQLQVLCVRTESLMKISSLFVRSSGTLISANRHRLATWRKLPRTKLLALFGLNTEKEE